MAALVSQESQAGSPVHIPVAVLWQDWCVTVAKMIKIYCAVSVGFLFIITWLLVTGNLIDEPFAAGEQGFMAILKPITQPHTHSIQFYAIVITILASLRGGIFYMGIALGQAAKERDSGAIVVWLITASVIVGAELLLGIALFQCLPGVLVVLLYFIAMEVLAQATFLWIVWSFKNEIDAEVLQLQHSLRC